MALENVAFVLLGDGFVHVSGPRASTAGSPSLQPHDAIVQCSSTMLLEELLLPAVRVCKSASQPASFEGRASFARKYWNCQCKAASCGQ